MIAQAATDAQIAAEEAKAKAKAKKKR
jgi:hypothetical protein